MDQQIFVIYQPEITILVNSVLSPHPSRLRMKLRSDGSVSFIEEDGIDYAPTTVQLPGGERVAFLLTVKQLNANGSLDNFGGEFNVPSYRGSSFLDPKGRGGSTGYDTAMALPARGDDEELVKENTKNTAAPATVIRSIGMDFSYQPEVEQ